MRRAAKIDGNQTEIVSALQAAGAIVQSLASQGAGVPDILCGFRNQLFLLECKDGRKAPSARALTAAQEKWHERWAGMPVHIVETPEQALRAIGAIA